MPLQSSTSLSLFPLSPPPQPLNPTHSVLGCAAPTPLTLPLRTVKVTAEGQPWVRQHESNLPKREQFKKKYHSKLQFSKY